jgi:hypothetical protein
MSLALLVQLELPPETSEASALSEIESASIGEKRRLSSSFAKNGGGLP